MKSLYPKTSFLHLFPARNLECQDDAGNTYMYRAACRAWTRIPGLGWNLSLAAQHSSAGWELVIELDFKLAVGGRGAIGPFQSGS